MRHGIVDRRLTRARHRHNCQICALASFERPYLLSRAREPSRHRWSPFRARVAAGMTRGSPVLTLCRSAANRIASNMSRSLLLAAPSVPSPTVTPAARYSGTGAMPLASFMLLSGLCDTGNLMTAENLHVGRIDPDAVIRNRSRSPEPDRLKVSDRASSRSGLSGTSRVPPRSPRHG